MISKFQSMLTDHAKIKGKTSWWVFFILNNYGTFLRRIDLVLEKTKVDFFQIDEAVVLRETVKELKEKENKLHQVFFFLLVFLSLF